MKNTIVKFLIAGFIVQWTLMFSTDHGKTWEKKARLREFPTQSEAFDFLAHSPTPGAKFSCTDSDSGTKGLCVVLNVGMPS